MRDLIVFKLSFHLNAHGLGNSLPRFVFFQSGIANPSDSSSQLISEFIKQYNDMLINILTFTSFITVYVSEMFL